MPAQEANELSQIIRQRMEEFKGLCKGLDEETAALAPSGRWSPKQIVSHLCGPEGTGHMPGIRAFLNEDRPRLDIEVENPFFSGKRAQMTLTELVSEFDKEYNGIADFVAQLSEEQLNRKAHIPMLKGTPFGEFPALAAWIRAIGDGHLGMHIDHMREILQSLGGSQEQPRE